jgi:hypothetical protein
MIRVLVLAQQDWRRWARQRLIQAGGRNSATAQLSGEILTILLLSQSLRVLKEWIKQDVNNRDEGKHNPSKHSIVSNQRNHFYQK